MEFLENLKLYAVIAGLAFCGLLALFPLIGKMLGEFRKQGIGFCLIAVGFFYAIATKPSPTIPTVIWDDYLTDCGSRYVTNGTEYVGVDLKWVKTNPALPASQPLYISKRFLATTNDWELFGTTTVGAYRYTGTLSNTTNYQFIVWHEWTPPVPVHTNGVWLGTVLEKSKGSVGVDKMIIIKGKLINNGKEIAP